MKTTARYPDAKNATKRIHNLNKNIIQFLLKIGRRPGERSLPCTPVRSEIPAYKADPHTSADAVFGDPGRTRTFNTHLRRVALLSS